MPASNMERIQLRLSHTLATPHCADVVSDHMHALISKLNGAALPGSRPGARGCHYWLPPRPGKTFEDFATAS